jgi:hypothetical protein
MAEYTFLLLRTSAFDQEKLVNGLHAALIEPETAETAPVYEATVDVPAGDRDNLHLRVKPAMVALTDAMWPRGCRGQVNAANVASSGRDGPTADF